MSTIDKLRKRFYTSPTPKNITMDEVIRLANYYKCIVRPGGNHQVSIVSMKTGAQVPLPQHDKEVKQVYIRELQDLFDDEEMERK